MPLTSVTRAVRWRGILEILFFWSNFGVIIYIYIYIYIRVAASTILYDTRKNEGVITNNVSF